MANPDVCFIVSTPMFYTPENEQKQWPIFGLLLLNSMKRYLTGSYKVIAVETEEEESIVDLKAYCEQLGPNFQYERISHPYPDYPISAKIEAMKKAVQADKAVVLIDVDAGWWSHMDTDWFDLGDNYDIGSFAGLNVSRTFPFTGKDWDYLRETIDNKGQGPPKNPRELGNCGTHITILNPRFVNIPTFVDHWLETSIKMFKKYPYRECDNAAFTLLTEQRRIKWVERDMHNCTFDYVNMGILLARFNKLVALAQELYRTDRVFQETVDKSPHRGGIVKTMLMANVGPANPEVGSRIIIPFRHRELYRLNSAATQKYYYYNNPFSRAMMAIKPKVAAALQTKRAKIAETTTKQAQSLELISNPKAMREHATTNNNSRASSTSTQPTTSTTNKPNFRLQALYEKLRANNLKKIMHLGSSNLNERAKFYPTREKEFGRFY